MKKQIAFLTSSNYQSIVAACPDFVNEFQLLQPIFSELNADLVQVDWRNAAIDWKKFDVLTPKACWDYAAHAAEFERFLKNIVAHDIPMKNAARTVLWNMRKTYLQDLQRLGLPVAELLIVPQGSQKNISEYVGAINNAGFKTRDMFVAKPSIGGGAVDTVRFAIDSIADHAALFKKILLYADLILQPYFPEIAQEGEYSYFFFGGKFSHAILKVPASGDYRAHQLHGAKNLSYTPATTEIREVLSFVSAVQPAPEYARVDVFKKNNILQLVELELIEPYLYFERASKEALRNFCLAMLEENK
jgi:hypothetical protein